MTPPRISDRAARIPASPIRRLMPFADEARRRGTRVYHLNIGQPDVETPAALRDRIRALREPVIAYTPSGGTPEYLQSLRGYYARLGIPLELDQVMATTGGSEAILFAMLACAAEGDDALVVEPFYTNYAAFATMAGVRLVPLTATADDGFHLPPREAWESTLTPRTRMVLLCNPNNPTGTVYGRDEVAMVLEFCRAHGLFLVSDEVYRELVYDGARALSPLTFAGYEDLVVVADSLSKRFSACGIRLGCLVTRNREVYQACLRMGQARLSAPGLAQVAATGMDELGPDYFDGLVAEFQRRRDLLYEGLRGIPGVFLRKPEGAFYFVARLPVRDSDDFARWMLAEFEHEGGTVMVAPAAGFYATPGLGSDEVRIAYVLNERDLAAAVRILARGLETYCHARGLHQAAPSPRPAGPDSTLPPE